MVLQYLIMTVCPKIVVSELHITFINVLRHEIRNIQNILIITYLKRTNKNSKRTTKAEQMCQRKVETCSSWKSTSVILEFSLDHQTLIQEMYRKQAFWGFRCDIVYTEHVWIEVILNRYFRWVTGNVMYFS